jgi:hypothetical protein
MSRKPKKRKKRKPHPTQSKITRRKDEYYTAGELFMAAVGVGVILLVVGLIVTSIW